MDCNKHVRIYVRYFQFPGSDAQTCQQAIVEFCRAILCIDPVMSAVGKVCVCVCVCGVCV